MKRRAFIAGLGGTAAWPLVARAQQPSMPVIGIEQADPRCSIYEYTPRRAARIGYWAGGQSKRPMVVASTP